MENVRGGIGSTSKGNTLEVWATGLSATSVDNFQNYVFVAPQTAINSETAMLTLENKVVMGSAELAVTIANDVTIQVNDKIKLIEATSDSEFVTTDTPISGLTKSGGSAYDVKGGNDFVDMKFELAKVGDTLVATSLESKASKNAKSVVEGQTAGVALLTEGADLSLDAGLDNALSVARAGDYTGKTAFGAMRGGHSRYKTGSHIGMTSFNLMTGVSKEVDLSQNFNTVLVGFVEAGYGDYDTHNPGIKGDGKTKYYGLGFLAHAGTPAEVGPYGAYVARLGGLKNEWSATDLSGTNYNLATSLYYGASVKFGFLGKVNNVLDYDVYGRFSWTHQNGKSATVKGAKYDFDDVDSLKTRLGATVNYAVNNSCKATFGLAWDHEFKGKANATVNNVAIDAPTLKGDTGVVEVSMKYKPEAKSAWDVTAGARGYFGRRTGANIEARLNYRFW